MNSRFLIAGAVFGLLAVILGAFAAHGLKEVISEEAIASFETGVKFQMYHAILLLILGGLNQMEQLVYPWLFYLISLGVILFSGSIYLLSTNSLWSFDFTTIALITPLGGTFLILSWGILLLNFIKLKKK